MLLISILKSLFKSPTKVLYYTNKRATEIFYRHHPIEQVLHWWLQTLPQHTWTKRSWLVFPPSGKHPKSGDPVGDLITLKHYKSPLYQISMSTYGSLSTDLNKRPKVRAISECCLSGISDHNRNTEGKNSASNNIRVPENLDTGKDVPKDISSCTKTSLVSKWYRNSKIQIYSVFETPHSANHQLSAKSGEPGTAGLPVGTITAPRIGEVSDPHSSQRLSSCHGSACASDGLCAPRAALALCWGQKALQCNTHQKPAMKN